MYRIIESVNPYNARTHYNGQEVVKYDGSTPVKWIIMKDINTLPEAQRSLMQLAKSSREYESGSWNYEDDDTVDNMCESWYQGPGVYCRDGGEPYPILLEGEQSFSDDVENYYIEEY